MVNFQLSPNYNCSRIIALTQLVPDVCLYQGIFFLSRKS